MQNNKTSLRSTNGFVWRNDISSRQQILNSPLLWSDFITNRITRCKEGYWLSNFKSITGLVSDYATKLYLSHFITMVLILPTRVRTPVERLLKPICPSVCMRITTSIRRIFTKLDTEEFHQMLSIHYNVCQNLTTMGASHDDLHGILNAPKWLVGKYPSQGIPGMGNPQPRNTSTFGKSQRSSGKRGRLATPTVHFLICFNHGPKAQLWAFWDKHPICLTLYSTNNYINLNINCAFKPAYFMTQIKRLWYSKQTHVQTIHVEHS
jgi:hypothetical protein